MDETLPTIPAAPGVAERISPPGYATSLLLVLAVLVLSQMAGETVLAMRDAPQALGARTLVLLGIGGLAVVGLIVINARWLWVTLGTLRYMLALITVWGVSALLGTLVVQRLPDQTDEAYAIAFTEATGDFLYHATHPGGGVVVHPEPDAQEWFSQQERQLGESGGDKVREQWMRDATGRLEAQAIRDWTAAHDGLLHDMLATVWWLRLPEASGISVWPRTLLILLCISLVIVVIQRGRGASRA